MSARVSVLLLLAALTGCASPQLRGVRAMQRGDLELATTWADRTAASGALLDADLLRVDIAMARGEPAEAASVLAPHESADAPHAVWSRSWTVGVATDDARRAADAWIALDGQLDATSLDDDTLHAIARALVPYGPSALDSLLRAARGEPTPEAVQQLEPTLDLLLYQAALRGDVSRALDEIDAWESTLGARFVIDKHRTLLHLSSPARRDGVTRLSSLTGDDPILITALAFEFAARGAVRAAEQAYRHVAAVDERSAPTALIEAGRLAYRSLREDDARSALRDAWEQSGRSVTIAARAVEVADSRDDPAFAAALASEAVAELPCDEENTEVILRLEQRVARAALLDNAWPTIAERFERRITLGCPEGQTSAVAAPLLAEADAIRLADGFFDRAIRHGPDRARQTIAAVQFAARGARVDRIITVVESWLLYEQPGAASDPDLRDLLREIDASLPDDRTQQVAAWLSTAFETQPQSGYLARRLAFEMARGADVEATLARYIAAADDPLAARARTALWRVEAGDESDELVAFIEALAEDAAGSGAEPPFVYRGAGTFESTAWMLHLDVLMARGERDRAIESAREIARAAATDPRTSWRIVWQHRSFRDSLRPDQLHRLLTHAINAGFSDPDALVADGLALLDIGEIDAAIDRLQQGLERASQLVDLADRLLGAGHAWHLLDLLPYVSDDTDPGSLSIVEADAWLRLASTEPHDRQALAGWSGSSLRAWRVAVFEARAVAALERASALGASDEALLRRLRALRGQIELRRELLGRSADLTDVADLTLLVREGGWTADLAASFATLDVEDPRQITPRLLEIDRIPFAAASTLAERTIASARGDAEQTVAALRLVSALVFRTDRAPDAWLPLLRREVLPDLYALLDPAGAPPQGAASWSIETRRATGCAVFDRLTWTFADAGAWADADALLQAFGRSCPTSPQRYLSVRRAAREAPLTTGDFREALALQPELVAYELASPWSLELVRPNERTAAAEAALEAARLLGSPPSVIASLAFAREVDSPDAPQAARAYADALLEEHSTQRQLEGALRLLSVGHGAAALDVLRAAARHGGSDADVALPLAARVEAALGRTSIVDELTTPRSGPVPSARVQFLSLLNAGRARAAVDVAEQSLRSEAAADAWRWIVHDTVFERTGRLDLVVAALHAGGSAAAPLRIDVSERLRRAGDPAAAAALTTASYDTHARLARYAQRVRDGQPIDWRLPAVTDDLPWELTAMREVLTAYQGVNEARAWLEARLQDTPLLNVPLRRELALVDAHTGAWFALDADDRDVAAAAWRAGADEEVMTTIDPHRDPAWAAMRGQESVLASTGRGRAMLAAARGGDLTSCDAAPVDERVACAWQLAATPRDWIALADLERGQPASPLDDALMVAMTGAPEEAAAVSERLAWDPTPRPIQWPRHPPVEPDAPAAVRAAWLRASPEPTEALLAVADLLDAREDGLLNAQARDAVLRRGCDGFGVADLMATANEVHAYDIALAVGEAGVRCGTLHAPALLSRATAALQLGHADSTRLTRALLDAAPEPAAALEWLLADVLSSAGAVRTLAPEATRLLASGARSPLLQALRAVDRAQRGDTAGALDDLVWTRGSSQAWSSMVPHVAAALVDGGHRNAAVEAAALLLPISYGPRSGVVNGATEGLWAAIFALEGDAEAVELLLAHHAPGASEHPVLSGIASAWVPALEASGRMDEALLLSERVYRHSPLSTGAANQFAWERALAGDDLVRAEHAARSALARSTLHTASPSVLDTLAMVLLRRGQVEEALSWQRLALRRAAEEGYGPAHAMTRSLQTTMQLIEAELVPRSPTEEPQEPSRRGRRATSRQ